MAQAIRLEIEEKTGRVFIVFEVLDEKLKQDIKKNWIEDIEYKLINKSLIASEE